MLKSINKIKIFFTFILIAVVFSASSSVFAEEGAYTGSDKQDGDIVEINAEAAVLMELATGKVIYDKNMNEKMYPASTTKMLTALVALDYLGENELVTVGSEILEISGDSSKAGHQRGETLNTKALIRGLIIPSGNDTANIIASAVAKKISGDNSLPFSQYEQMFTDLMNKKAAEIGCNNSNFVNAHGYHDDEHYTTAYDMALISAKALENPVIKEVAAEKEYTGSGADNVPENDATLIVREYDWKSHNELITDSEYYYEYATGIKTGFTGQAGSCVAASAKKDDVELIAVILNSGNSERWDDAKALFEYGFNNYSFIDLQKNGDIIDTVDIYKRETLNAVAKNNLKEYVKNSDINNISTEIKYNEELIAENKDSSDNTIRLLAPIEKDAQIGRVTYSLNGIVLHEADLFAETNIEKITLLTNINYYGNIALEKLKTPAGIISAIITVILIIMLITVIVLRKGRRQRYTMSKTVYRLPKNKGRKGRKRR